MDQNIKIGDKFLCKMNYCYIILQKFHEGVEYEVYDIKKIDNGCGFYYYSYSMIDNVDFKLLYVIEYELNNIFYSGKEMRKIKLEKLNEKS